MGIDQTGQVDVSRILESGNSSGKKCSIYNVSIFNFPGFSPDHYPVENKRTHHLNIEN